MFVFQVISVYVVLHFCHVGLRLVSYYFYKVIEIMAAKFKSPMPVNGRMSVKRKVFPTIHHKHNGSTDHAQKRFKQNGWNPTSNGNGLSNGQNHNGTSHHGHDNLLRERQALPIFPAKDRIVEEVRKAETVIIVGETASGKTTQIPQFLYQSSLATKGCIACTQPRRVAAITVAER